MPKNSTVPCTANSVLEQIGKARFNRGDKRIYNPSVSSLVFQPESTERVVYISHFSESGNRLSFGLAEIQFNFIDYRKSIQASNIMSHEGEHHGNYDGSSIKVTRSTVLFALCAALNSCNLGYDIGVSTNAGPLVQSEFGMSDIQRELFVGSLNFWSIFGSVFSHWICDYLGRRKAFQVAALHFIVGVLIMASANGFATLMVGR